MLDALAGIVQLCEKVVWVLEDTEIGISVLNILLWLEKKQPQHKTHP